MAKKLIFFVLIVVLVFGICSPVLATEVTSSNDTENASVSTQETTEQEDTITVGDVIIIIVFAPLAGLLLYAVADDVTTNGLFHSRYTPVGRINRALDSIKKE